MRGALTLLAVALSIGTALASPFIEDLAAAQTFPNPAPIKGSFFFVHDPSLVQRKVDGKYFLFTTHDKGGIITADNLQGLVANVAVLELCTQSFFSCSPWKEVGSIVPKNSSIDLPGRDDIWAPDVTYYKGKYYAYYSVSTFGSQNSAIGLATSSSMDPGTWTDHGLVFRSYTNNLYNAIDPNFAVDELGRPFLSFGKLDTFMLPNVMANGV
jgi:arabinan endo-1,5-alpha-L-arabinosidase